jgi:hypothetical protein
MSTAIPNPIPDVVVSDFGEENRLKFRLQTPAAVKFLMVKQPPIRNWRWLSGGDEDMMFAVERRYCPALIRKMKKNGLVIEGVPEGIKL